MKAKVIKIDVPVISDIAIPAYRVDIEDYQVIGYHESTTRKATFNVYENEAIANYVANAINKGEIIPYMMEIDHTFPEDQPRTNAEVYLARIGGESVEIVKKPKE